jgi:hypothetical protein
MRTRMGLGGHEWDQEEAPLFYWLRFLGGKGKEVLCLHEGWRRA